MSAAQLFWTIAAVVGTFLVCFTVIGWVWWLSAIVAWLAAGVMASISGVK